MQCLSVVVILLQGKLAYQRIVQVADACCPVAAAGLVGNIDHHQLVYGQHLSQLGPAAVAVQSLVACVDCCTRVVVVYQVACIGLVSHIDVCGRGVEYWCSVVEEYQA